MTKRRLEITRISFRNISLENNVTKESGKGQWNVSFGTQRNVSVSGLQSFKGQNSLAQQFTTFVVDSEPQNCQLGQNYLEKHTILGTLALFRTQT